MSRRLAVTVAVLATLLVSAAAAQAAPPSWLARYMHHHPGGKLVSAPMLASVRHHRVHSANSVSFNCGTSYLYISPAGSIGRGWVTEVFGLKLHDPLLGGGGVVSWTNTSTGGHNAYIWGFGFNAYGIASHMRYAYVRKGWVYSVLWAHATVLDFWPFPHAVNCYTPYGQPHSITYA